MNENNIFNQSEEQEQEIFPQSSNLQITVVEEESLKTCPPGHYRSIQAGGNGHSIGDNCGCEVDTVSVDNYLYISAGIIIALLLIFKYTKNDSTKVFKS